jgi:hypothetical protein
MHEPSILGDIENRHSVNLTIHCKGFLDIIFIKYEIVSKIEEINLCVFKYMLKIK